MRNDKVYRPSELECFIRFSSPRFKRTLFMFSSAFLALLASFAFPVCARRLLSIASIDASVSVVIVRFLILWVLLLPIVSILVFGFSRTGSWLHKNRFIIAVCIVLFAVIFDVNGSSLGQWDALLGHPSNAGIALGKSQALRTDEYMGLTPLAFSQKYNNYRYFSTIPSGQSTDLFIIKDAPVLALAEIFRPFQWGYLFLGSSRGLAFYWSARMVALFLCMYELIRLMTASRRLAAAGATLVTYSPIVQWWYAVNSIVELLIAASLAIVLFNHYCHDHNSWHRLSCAAVICQCGGMFILALYPALQVPFAYLIMILLAWSLAENWKNIHMTLRDWLWVVVCVAVTILLLGTVLYYSRPTIVAALNTVYPGHRVSTGDDMPFLNLFNGFTSMLYSLKDYVGPVNASETAQMVDFFPLGLLLALYQLFKLKKKDVLSILLFIYSCAMCLFMTVGVPEWLASVTLFSRVTGSRCYLGFAIANVLLLCRCLSRPITIMEKRFSLAIVLIYALLIVVISRRYNPAYAGKLTLSIVAVLVVLIGFGLLFIIKKYDTVVSICIASLAMFAVIVCGGLVNPTRIGAEQLDNQSLSNQARTIQNKHAGLWIVEGPSRIGDNIPQLLVANGVPAFNSIQVTPHLSAWRKIDPTGKYANVYNRYAYVAIEICERESAKPFRLVTPDRIQVSLTPEQLHKFGITYVMSQSNLTAVQHGRFGFEQVGLKIDGWYTYRIMNNS